ncbi:uncharacterized protein LOC125369187 [Ricinus communis]|uniref:uncharacterized protein LOC125369187 n=1 Tax=Ricinus communis TaxID=3988 RepID=UPI00201AFDBF|nr:uncharacterized protein LOC125369187 [Ricinus communis]
MTDKEIIHTRLNPPGPLIEQVFYSNPHLRFSFSSHYQSHCLQQSKSCTTRHIGSSYCVSFMARENYQPFALSFDGSRELATLKFIGLTVLCSRLNLVGKTKISLEAKAF